jgi:hypothetical protein
MENSQVIDNANEEDLDQEDKQFNINEFEQQIMGEENFTKISEKLQLLRNQKDARDTVNTKTGVIRSELKELGFNSKMQNIVLSMMDMEPEKMQKTLVAVKYFTKLSELPVQIDFLNNVTAINK